MQADSQDTLLVCTCMRSYVPHPELWQPLLAVVAVQTVATVAVSWLHSRHAWLRRYLGFTVSIAVGVLLATAAMHLLPESVDALGNTRRMWAAFCGTMIFLFAVERIFSALTGSVAETTATESLSSHQHHHGHHTTRPMNLVFGGMLHSFVDGVSAAAAFSINLRVGLFTALAITLHEIPHRLGDFALFLHLGVKPRRALYLAVVVGVPSLLGVAVVAAVGAAGEKATVWMLPVSAASFFYIASANLIPELQHECRMSRVFAQIGALIGGALLIYLLGQIPGA